MCKADRAANSLAYRDGRLDRRRFVTFAVVTLSLSPAMAQTPLLLPKRVAGIEMPRSSLCLAATRLSHSACPDYLFNHSMRTFLFGALALEKQQKPYNAECAFAAAALHDLGLLTEFATATGPFEFDGANRAEELIRERGGSQPLADRVWHAIALHDSRWPLAPRQGPEAELVALGAAGDVDGLDPEMAADARVQEILAAFPRLNFKQRFTALLVDHCRRKPTSQRGTWLEGLCRQQVPSAWTERVDSQIQAANFSE